MARSVLKLRTIFVPIFLLVLLVGSLVGCGEREGIRVYKIAKEDDRGRAGGPKTTPASLEEQLLLGAIVPEGQKYWVFKLAGDPDVVTRNREEFLGIVNSVEFDTGRPTWKLAEGWTERKVGGITYAEWLKESDAIKATVTELPILSNFDSWSDVVVSNVNRWRKGLALEERDWDRIEPELEEVESLSQGEKKAYFVSLKGKGSGGMSSGMGPFQRAMMQDSAAAESQVAASTPVSPEPTLDFNPPEGWEQLDVSNSSMRKAAFEVRKDDLKAELTIVPASGDIAGNMGMWFSQVGLEPSEGAIGEVVSQGVPVRVHDVDGMVYELNADGSQGSSAILIAEIPWRDDQSLFVKLMGESEVIKDQRENFFEFVKSIRW